MNQTSFGTSWGALISKARSNLTGWIVGIAGFPWKRERRVAVAWEHSLGYPIALAMISLVAVAQIALATPRGLQIYADSFYYVAGSENLAAFRGFGRLSGGGDFIPITKFPPFFSVTMAALELIGLERLNSAYWINLSSYALLVLTVGLLMRLETGSKPASLLASLFVGLSPILLGVHVGLMSEPLFLVLSFAAISAFHRYLTNDRLALLILSAVLLALAFLTRYIGISLIGTCAVAIVLQRSPIRQKARRLGLLLAIGLTPMGIWMLRNLIHTGNAANRAVLWHPILFAHLRSLALNMLEWFVPPVVVRGKLFAIAWLLLLGALALVFAITIRSTSIRPGLRSRGQLGPILSLLILLYLGSLAVSLSLFDPEIPVDSRILSPVYLATILVFTLAVYHVWIRSHGPGRFALAALVAALLSWNAIEQSHDAWTIRQHDLNYPPPHLSASETIAALLEFPQFPLISNKIDRLYFSSDRYSYSTPVMLERQTNKRRPSYEAELEQMRERVREDCALLVLFDPESYVGEQALLSDLTEGLQLIGRYDDGVIYRQPSADEQCGL